MKYISKKDKDLFRALQTRSMNLSWYPSILLDKNDKFFILMQTLNHNMVAQFDTLDGAFGFVEGMEMMQQEVTQEIQRIKESK